MHQNYFTPRSNQQESFCEIADQPAEEHMWIWCVVKIFIDYQHERLSCDHVMGRF